MKKPVKANDMFIDIGATSREDAQMLGVRAGTPITSDMKFRSLGNDMVTGKALDDRGGCAVLVEVLRQLKDVKATVHAVFTVQEEVGLKGGRKVMTGRHIMMSAIFCDLFSATRVINVPFRYSSKASCNYFNVISIFVDHEMFFSY